MVGKLTKAEGDNKNMAKEINDMRLVINTTDKEELMKIIEEQKRKMCNMEEENINIFNENTYFKEESQKAFQNRKDLEIVFQITINDLNHIILKKDEEIQNLLTTIASETRTETSPGTSLEAPPGTSPGTASGTTPETAPHIAPPSENPLWRPFEDRAVVSPPALDSPPIQEVDECVQSVQCNGNCEHVVCHKVTFNDCKQKFSDKVSMMDHKQDSDHPSRKKCNKPDCERGERCWYVHRNIVPLGNQQTAQENTSFTCNDCQQIFSERSALMFHKKRTHPSNIICKNFLNGHCRQGNDGERCWYRHEILPTLALNVARPQIILPPPGSPNWDQDFPVIPTMGRSSMVGLQQQMMVTLQRQKQEQQLQQQQQHQQQMAIIMGQLVNLNM